MCLTDSHLKPTLAMTVEVKGAQQERQRGRIMRRVSLRNTDRAAFGRR